jgi:hypothetical protein
MSDIVIEAQIFAKYITGKPGNIIIYQHYANGVSMLKLAFNTREERMMGTLRKRPFLLPLCDAGLAILSPQCTLRKRLLLMFALIETDKNFTTDFISITNNSFPFTRLLIRGCAGVLKAITGVIFILLMRWK